MRTRQLALWWLAGGGLFSPAISAAEAGPVTSSPFLPAAAGNATTGPVADAAPLELHGIIVTTEGPRFSIFNRARKSATWVYLNEPGPEFTVRTYKEVGGTDQVTVE